MCRASTSRVPKTGVAVALLAVAITFARSSNLKKVNYKQLFTEQEHGSSTVKHPGNAYSSLAFAAVGVWLAWAPVPLLKMSRQSDVVVLLWLSVVSFRFHATESLWVETQDLWCVIYLCVSCLSRYVANTDARAVLFTWLAMGGLLIDAVAEPVGSAVVEQYYIGIIGVLVYVLLWYSQSSWWQFGLLLIAFVAKVADMAAAGAGKWTSSPVNGTSMFHLLTASALWVHYRDVVVERVSKVLQ